MRRRSPSVNWPLALATVGAIAGGMAGLLLSQYLPFYGGILVQMSAPFSEIRLQTAIPHCFICGLVLGVAGGLLGLLVNDGTP